MPAEIVTTYTAAADHFDRLPFWHHFGRRTIERLRLRPGQRVVDLCCGTGASALPAAAAVGPTGSVLGVDITAALVEQAAAKAREAGWTHAAFQCAAVETLELRPASVDAVVSVFGLFFVEDMAALLQRAATWLVPGGALAITTWGAEVLAPGEALFWDAVRAERASIVPTSHASRLDTPDKLAAIFTAGGLPAPEVVHDRWAMPLATPDEFWPVIMGTSNRGAYEALSPDARERVRARVLHGLRHQAVTETTMDVLYAVARRGLAPKR
jgi:ubiquinone/menaquinone biosynthesis C-methylase UbiE